MRVMIDTNVILSALMFPNSKPAQALMLVAEKHDMVLCDHIVNEVRDKVNLKRPDLLSVANELLDTIVFETVPAGEGENLQIGDPDDAPILNAAISGKVDIIVSGDKHFKDLDLVSPKTQSPAEFLLKDAE
jgi:putative PIN family toxin of toxin-antitoxin system